jgi:DNA-binding NarL/FixJ family response regulator
MTDQHPPVLVLVRDLLFASKIRATAHSIDATVRMLREPAQVTGAEGRRLIVDLNQPGALDAAVAWKRGTGGEVVGFVSHVDAQTIQAARTAGLDQVLPRSRFVEVLAELLR